MQQPDDIPEGTGVLPAAGAFTENPNVFPCCSRYVIIASRGIITASKSETEGERICFVTAQFAVGGADNLLMSICSLLAAHGYRIVIYSALPGENPRLEERCRAHGIEIRYAAGRGMRGRIALNHLRYWRTLLSRGIRSRLKTSELLEQVKGNHRMVMERHINPRYISNLAKSVQRDHQREPFSRISGFHPALLPALHSLKQTLGIPVYYTEISSPRYRSVSAHEDRTTIGELTSTHSIA